MKLLSIVFFLSLSFLSPIEWTTDFAKAKTEANSQHKYILLNFSGSDWCGPCIKLKKEVLDSPEFLQYADNKLVLVRADFPRNKKNRLSPELTKHNEALAEKYNNQGKFPYTVLIDADGKIVKSWEGYTANMTIANLKVEIEQLVKLK
ncbi:thioredoxin family protein [Arcicella sp. LKC2W]|uniref:thioredoxin family protein n=1 Tax=Arcicella sp. LKC2W TaxID=2984198 RepID=UPI002B21A67D|nr:thioredoxin family protein [Arcicella sp. LKC2W]MEA5459292.1 thioredoxin family protein [Arcicella sp. LKC2W]